MRHTAQLSLLDLPDVVQAPAGARRVADQGFDDVEWPIVALYTLPAGNGVPGWLAMQNSLELAREAEGARRWAAGIGLSWHATHGGCGFGFGALPRWGVYETRVEAIATMELEFEREAVSWPDHARNRALLRAWNKLLRTALMSPAHPGPGEVGYPGESDDGLPGAGSSTRPPDSVTPPTKGKRV